MQAIDPISWTCCCIVAGCAGICMCVCVCAIRLGKQAASEHIFRFSICIASILHQWVRVARHTIKGTNWGWFAEHIFCSISHPPVSFHLHPSLHTSTALQLYSSTILHPCSHHPFCVVFSKFIHFDCILLRLFHFGIFVFIPIFSSLDENKYGSEIDAGIHACSSVRSFVRWLVGWWWWWCWCCCCEGRIFSCRKYNNSLGCVWVCLSDTH